MKLIRLLAVAVLCVGALSACKGSLVDPTPEEDHDDPGPGTGDNPTMIIEFSPGGILV